MAKLTNVLREQLSLEDTLLEETGYLKWNLFYNCLTSNFLFNKVFKEPPLGGSLKGNVERVIDRGTREPSPAFWARV